MSNNILRNKENTADQPSREELLEQVTNIRASITILLNDNAQLQKQLHEEKDANAALRKKLQDLQEKLASEKCRRTTSDDSSSNSPPLHK